MGSRARRKGIANDVLRAASRALNEQDRQASMLAQAVYVAAREWRREDGPMLVMAPVQVSAQNAAPFVTKQLGLPQDEATVVDVAALLTYGWLEMIAKLTPEDYQRWKDHADAQEAAASTEGVVDGNGSADAPGVPAPAHPGSA